MNSTIEIICTLCGKTFTVPPLLKSAILEGEVLPDTCQECPPSEE